MNKTNKNIEIFESHASEYDQWFDKNSIVFETELNALKKAIPPTGNGIEIGVGTGRFAAAFNIATGVEPAKSMADIARARGIHVIEGVAEKLPLENAAYDFILFVATLCFVQDLRQVLSEARRILKAGGRLIIGMLDVHNEVGQQYLAKIEESKFYRGAHFSTVEEIMQQLHQTGFQSDSVWQTLFRLPWELTAPEEARSGHGDGLFVVIEAQVISETKATTSLERHDA